MKKILFFTSLIYPKILLAHDLEISHFHNEQLYFLGAIFIALIFLRKKRS